MKKLFAILMCLVMCFSLCACGGEREEDVNVQELVEETASSSVYLSVVVDYNVYPVVNVASCRRIEENTYSVSGKVSIRDEYGDTYTGTFDATVEYDPQTKDASTTDYEVSKLYKD